MKILKYVIIAIVVAILATITVCAVNCLSSNNENNPDKTPPIVKTDEDLIFERVESFETAYNTGDFNELLNSFDAKTRNALQAIFNLMGGIASGLTGVQIDLADLFALGISMETGDYLQFTEMSLQMDGNDNATVTAKMDLAQNNNQVMYIYLVRENGGWYICDMLDKKPQSSNPNDDQTSTYVAPKISKAGEFIGGYALIDYYQGYENYTAFIDKEGNIVFILPQAIESYYIGNGAYLLNYGKEIKIANNKGIVVEFKFDTLLGYGDGFVVFHQDQSTMMEEKQVYCAYDQNGNFYDIEQILGIDITDQYDFEYLGDGMFGYYEDWNLCKIVNMKTKSIISITNFANTKFENGFAYVNRWGSCTITSDKYPNGKSIENPFLLYTDGSVLEIEEPEYFLQGRAIYTSGEYVKVVDYTKSSPKTFTINNYPSSMIEVVEFVDDYALIEIEGKDGKEYFTVIDSQGNAKYEPKETEGWTLLLGQGYVFEFYYNIYNNKVYSPNGEEICSNLDIDLQVKNNIVTKVYESNCWNYTYYTLSGEKLFEELIDPNKAK